jgi:hypothetical protein
MKTDGNYPYLLNMYLLGYLEMLMIQSKFSSAKYEASIYIPPYLAMIAILINSDLVWIYVSIFLLCMNLSILLFSYFPIYF